jgi:[ribosomal protein S18]-alanine N-acetyltransferase
MEINLRKARKKDIPGIYAVETKCFITPWSLESFHFDICENGLALYIVALDGSRVAGFCGMHSILDEGHIMNVAVLEEYRGNGIGERLIKKMFELAPPEVESYTLEVREFNAPAKKLYEKLGFTYSGTRPGYYADTGENALIMWLKKD